MVLMGTLLVIGVILAVAFVMLRYPPFRRGSDRVARNARSSGPSTSPPSSARAAAPNPDPTGPNAVHPVAWQSDAASDDRVAGDGAGVGADESTQPVREPLSHPRSADELAKILDASRDQHFRLKVRIHVQIPVPDNAVSSTKSELGGSSPLAWSIGRDAVVYVPRSLLEKLQELWKTAREKAKDTIGENIAGTIDNPENLEKVNRLWPTSDPGGLAAAGEGVDNLGQSLHDALVGQHTQALAALLRVPGSKVIREVADDIPIVGIDNPLKAVRLGLNILGVAAGVALGHPLLSIGSFKGLVHSEVHELLVKVVDSVLFGPSRDGRDRSDSTKERTSRGSAPSRERYAPPPDLGPDDDQRINPQPLVVYREPPTEADEELLRKDREKRAGEYQSRRDWSTRDESWGGRASRDDRGGGFPV